MVCGSFVCDTCPLIGAFFFVTEMCSADLVNIKIVYEDQCKTCFPTYICVWYRCFEYYAPAACKRLADVVVFLFVRVTSAPLKSVQVLRICGLNRSLWRSIKKCVFLSHRCFRHGASMCSYVYTAVSMLSRWFQKILSKIDIQTVIVIVSMLSTLRTSAARGRRTLLFCFACDNLPLANVCAVLRIRYGLNRSL